MNATTMTTAAPEQILRALDMRCSQGSDMHTTTVLVTPETATAWLTRNQVNRPIDRNNLAKIKWALRNGAFRYMPQCVTFNRLGVLVDGQHRLTAIAETGIAGPLRVTFGFAGDVHDPFDAGKVRSIGDIVLRAQRSVATCAALALLTQGAQSVAAEQNQRVYEADRESIDWALRVTNGQRRMTGAMVAALAFAYPTRQEAVAQFALQLVNHMSPHAKAPTVALRKFLERESVTGTEGQLRLMHAALRAVKAHVEGKALSRIALGDAGYRYFADRRSRMGF